MSLNKEQVEDFHRIGFTVCKGFFAEGEIARISDWLDDLHDKTPPPGEEAKYYEKSPVTGDTILVRVEHVIGDFNRDISDLLICSKTTECLTQLFGEPPTLFKEKLNYKLPGCRPDKLHQDQAGGWTDFSDFFITQGIVVDPNRKDNAALSFMNSGNYEKRLMCEDFHPLTDDDPPYQPEDEYILLEADPGDVVFFDSFVPHGSPANTSDRSRRNVFLTFNRESDGDMRAAYYENKFRTYPANDPANARTADTYLV